MIQWHLTHKQYYASKLLCVVEKLPDHLRFRKRSYCLITHSSSKLLWLIQVIIGNSENSFVCTSNFNLKNGPFTRTSTRTAPHTSFRSQSSITIQKRPFYMALSEYELELFHGCRTANQSVLVSSPTLEPITRLFKFQRDGFGVNVLVPTPWRLWVCSLSWVTVFINVLFNFLYIYIHIYIIIHMVLDSKVM
jgi:hypothetical protein